MSYDLIGPVEPAEFLPPAEIVARLMRRFDQILVSRWEGQRRVQEMPERMRALIPDADDAYVVFVQDGVSEDPATPPRATLALEVWGEGDITVVYRDEAHREASNALLEAIEAALDYGRHD